MSGYSAAMASSPLHPQVGVGSREVRRNVLAVIVATAIVLPTLYGVAVLTTRSTPTPGTTPIVESPAAPVALAYDSEKGEMFVASYYANVVSVISDTTNTVVATVGVGLGPAAVAYDSGRQEVFVANYDSDTVSVISDGTNRVVATVSLLPRVRAHRDGVRFRTRGGVCRRVPVGERQHYLRQDEHGHGHGATFRGTRAERCGVR